MRYYLRFIVYVYFAVVVAQSVIIAAGIPEASSVQRHAVKCEIRIVLDEHQGLGGGDGPAAHSDVRIPQELECLGLRAGRTYCGAVHIIGVAVEIDGEVLPAGYDDSVSGAVPQNEDLTMLPDRIEGIRERVVIVITDLCHIHQIAVIGEVECLWKGYFGIVQERIGTGLLDEPDEGGGIADGQGRFLFQIVHCT